MLSISALKFHSVNKNQSQTSSAPFFKGGSQLVKDTVSLGNISTEALKKTIPVLNEIFGDFSAKLGENADIEHSIYSASQNLSLQKIKEKLLPLIYKLDLPKEAKKIGTTDNATITACKIKGTTVFEKMGYGGKFMQLISIDPHRSNVVLLASSSPTPKKNFMYREAFQLDSNEMQKYLGEKTKVKD